MRSLDIPTFSGIPSDSGGEFLRDFVCENPSKHSRKDNNMNLCFIFVGFDVNNLKELKAIY